MNIYCLSEGELYHIENGNLLYHGVMNGKPPAKVQSLWGLNPRNTAKKKCTIC